MEPGKSITAMKNLSYNEGFFQGHFPNEPVMPGVLIVEALAQAGAISILSIEENKGKTAYFAGIEKVRFRRKVVPGDTLILKVEITKMRGSIGIGEGKAFVGDELACEGQLIFAINKDGR